MKRKLTYILLCFALLLPIVAESQNKPVVVYPPKKEQPKTKLSNNRFSQNGNIYTVKGVSFEMIPVTSGSFMMGSDDPEAYGWEKPVHREYVSDFMIGKTEVTQALWKAVMGNNPSYFKGDKLPVENVSWDDCQTFIRKLNAITGKNFRLPTEPEWEYAARGGNRSNGYKYSGSNDIDAVAWYDDNSDSRTHIVATKRANELGIYDMTGNVGEWTQSLWSSDYNTARNGGSTGSCRVNHGGGWSSYARFCRVSYRVDYGPSGRSNDLGLRLAL